jgi:lipopolysaccharide export system permease protein
MKKIDRYILRQFALTVVFSLAAFTAIFLVIDLMENLDEFLDTPATSARLGGKATVGVILSYYGYFIPEIIKLMLPVSVLLSALFTTGRLSTYNELTALKSGGMSLLRYMAPFLVVSLLLSVFAIWFNGWVVPATNQKKFQISRAYFGKYIEHASKSNIFMQESRTRILAIDVYDDIQNTAYKVSIQEFDPADISVITARYDARAMLWNDTTRTWTLQGGMKRTFSAGVERVEPIADMPLAGVNFSPEDIRKKQQKPDEMTYTELGDFIEAQKRAGQDVSRWLVDYYAKIAFPFANLIVVIFGIPFSAARRRSGLGVEFGIAVAVCFLYMIFLKVSQAFGYNGDLDPLLTAWLANILFFTAGCATIAVARR